MQKIKGIGRLIKFGGLCSEGNFTKPTKECPNPGRWSALDCVSSEFEVMNFLQALVFLAKPKIILETGASRGKSTIFLAEALKRNGFGKVISLELKKENAEIVGKKIREWKLENYAEIVNCNSMDYETNENIDLLFLDSDVKIRGKEYGKFSANLSEGAIVCFHDTSKKHKFVRRDVKKLEKAGEISVIYINTPRGIAIAQKIRK